MNKKAYFHLPGLFEFYELYSRFLPLFYSHREYFYDRCEIASIYGSPKDTIWSGGRVSSEYEDPLKVLELVRRYGISPRLTFSNSLLKKEHLSDSKCNNLCSLFEKYDGGVIVHSELLLEYLMENYPGLYFVSSTTKVITDFNEFEKELERSEFSYVVPDFRLNDKTDELKELSQKNKVEFLMNECCSYDCINRKECYESVSRINLGMDSDYVCPYGKGYRFSDAMNNKGFIGVDDIEKYLKMGFSNFKIEGRGLGSALVFEFLLYYLVKPEYQLKVREEIYLGNMLDLF